MASVITEAEVSAVHMLDTREDAVQLTKAV